MNVVSVAELMKDGAAELVTGPFGTQLAAHEYVAEGTPVINVRNVGFGDVRTAELEYLDDGTVERLSRHQLREGDIVFGRKGAVERHAFISSSEDGWVQGSDCIRLRLDREVIEPRFVSFAFRTEWHKQWMQNHCSFGATMASLNQDILKLLEIPAPPLAIQRGVVRVLGAFDDLVENNRRRIEILEEMARLVYREWFVDFRFPGHEDVEFVESGLGAVPCGWEVSDLASVAASLTDGDWIETKDQGGSDFRLLQVSNIGVGSFRETGKYRYVTAETFGRLRCTEVLTGDVLISRMPDPIGRAWRVDHLPEPSITAVDVAILRPRTDAWSHYLVHFLNSPETIDRAEAIATGTTRKRIARSVLGQFSLLVPPVSVLEAFATRVGPMADLQTNLRRQNRALEQARDLLLPRMISGELDVSDLDRDLDLVV